MLHAHTARFDVTGTVALFGKTFRELNKTYKVILVGYEKVLRNLLYYKFTIKKGPGLGRVLLN